MAMLSRVVFVGLSLVGGCTETHDPGATTADDAAATMMAADAAATATMAHVDAAATMADSSTHCGETRGRMLDMERRCVGEGLLTICAGKWDGGYEACGSAITYGRDRQGHVFVFGDTCLPDSVHYVPTRTGTPEAQWGTWPDCEPRARANP